MKLILSIAAGIILAIVLLAVGCSAMVAGAEGYEAEKVAIQNGSKSEPATPETSKGNAVEQAESYLGGQHFSRSGLIDQLEYEGYSTADATYAVAAVSPDWNEQAAKAAASYLDGEAFSRSGLIEQLKYEGYTNSQAVYGVNQTGL